MALSRRIWQVFIYHLRMITATPRIPILCILIGVFIYSNLQPVIDFSKTVNIPAAPWAFPHLTNDFICQLVFMAGVIILFCDAPFNDEAAMYILPRAGSVSWSGGQVLYIIFVSFIYVLFILLISILSLVTSLRFEPGWGKIWGTLAKTSASSQFHLQFTVNDYLVGAYNPLRATFLSFLLEWACAAWLGLLLYLVNVATKKSIGNFVAAFFVLFDIAVKNDWMPAASAFSPTTLAQLSSLVGRTQQAGVNLGYSARFFVIGILLLAIAGTASGYWDRRLSWKMNRIVKSSKKMQVNKD